MDTDRRTRLGGQRGSSPPDKTFKVGIARSTALPRRRPYGGKTTCVPLELYTGQMSVDGVVTVPVDEREPQNHCQNRFPSDLGERECQRKGRRAEAGVRAGLWKQ